MSISKPINILSIDFDVFQVVDEDTIRMCYPDGVDLSTNISKFVWSTYYVNPSTGDMLNKVTINEPLIDDLKHKLILAEPDIPVLVTNSHVHIYDFIHNVMRDNDSITLNLTHADMHHDMFNDNYEIDCGNWIKFITEEYDTHLTWIANPISKSIMGVENDKRFNIVKTDFNDLVPEKLDAIFLCRSDIWTPPHLDPYFAQLLNFLCETFNNVKGEDCIKSVRDMTDIIKKQLDIFKNMKAKNI